MLKLLFGTISLILLIVLSWFLFWTTAWDLESKYHFLTVAGIKEGVILVILLLLGFLFFVFIIRSKSIREQTKNIALIVYMFFVVFFILEGVFIFVAQSQVAGTTLAYKRWMDYYWNPINEIGMRDRNIMDDNLQYKKKIIAIGDSFTAGHGIKKIEDRFPDKLQTMLPAHYRVLNLGRDGVDSSTELYRLFNFPIKPDVIIFQYFGNDIEGVCVAEGRDRERMRDEHFVQYRDYPEFSGVAKWLVKNSYFLNFSYWQLINRKDVSYFDFVIPCYQHPKILGKHVTMLQTLINYSKKENIPLVVVLFPFMLAIDESEFYMEGIRDLFTKQGIPVIDVGKIAKDIPPKKRIVGKLDTHAHPRVHKLIANELFRVLTEKQYIK